MLLLSYHVSRPISIQFCKHWRNIPKIFNIQYSIPQTGKFLVNRGRIMTENKLPLTALQSVAKFKYHRACDYRSLTEALSELAVRRPAVELGTLGTTILDRPIPIVTIGRSKHSRSVLYLGGIHPTDRLTPAVLLRFLSEYAEFLESGKSAYNVNLSYLFENRTIHICPMLNPDGYELWKYGAAEDVVRDRQTKQNGGDDFRAWRGNARGVDLWRNFTECPEESMDEETVCPQGTAGLSPESEPETASLCNYLRIFDEISAVLSLHSLGSNIRCFSADHYPPRARTVSRLLSRMTGCAPSPHPEEPTTSGGSLTDWFIRERNKPAFECGCLGDGDVDPTAPDDYLKVYTAFREALFSMPLLV